MQYTTLTGPGVTVSRLCLGTMVWLPDKRGRKPENYTICL
jgi:aryl-alcohol dehydrogenase-like predicted oxidoreductase